MPSCTNTCNSTTITAGTGIILKGGDHWVASDLHLQVSGNYNNGISGSPIYIGVDLTWFTGGS
jgi:hypothetical protein